MIPSARSTAIYHGRGDIRIEQSAVPIPAPGEPLLRVDTVGDRR